MKTMVDINCDMGESFGAYRIGRDKEVIQYITSANIACGFHASDPNVMEETLRLCREYRVMAGAHPGYPDLLGFGRRHLDVSLPELINYVIYQVGALQGFSSFLGMRLQHVKMHGALYNNLVNREEFFLDIITAVKKAFGDLIFFTLTTQRTADLKKICQQKGLRLALEAFPDRNYTDEGELLSRKHKEAVLKNPDTIAERAVRMVKDQGIESVKGHWINLNVDTLCIHGDNPESIEAAKKMRAAFKRAGIKVCPAAEFL